MATPLNKAQLRLRLRDTHSNFVDMEDDQADDLNNEANERIWRSFPNPRFAQTSATVAVTTGDNSVTLPADFDRPVAVLGLDNKPLGQLSFADWAQRAGQSLASAAYPNQFALYGSELMLSPTPAQNGNLNLYYLKKPVALTADGDYPAFPAEYHHLIITGATALAHLIVGEDVELYRAAQDIFDIELKKMQEDVQREMDVLPQDLGSAWNMGSLIQRIRTLVPDAPAGDTVISNICNDVVREVNSLHDWEHMRKTADLTVAIAGQVLGGPADLERPLILRNESSYGEMERWSHLEAVDYFASNASGVEPSGAPYVWSTYGWNAADDRPDIQLWPRPASSTNFRLYYARKTVPMVLPTDVPDLPLAYREVVVWAAASRLAMQVMVAGSGESSSTARGRADSYRKQADRLIENMRERLIGDAPQQFLEV